jgi:hypothetical protein
MSNAKDAKYNENMYKDLPLLLAYYAGTVQGPREN